MPSFHGMLSFHGMPSFHGMLSFHILPELLAALRRNGMHQHGHDLAGIEAVRQNLPPQGIVPLGIGNPDMIHPMLVHFPDEVIQHIGNPVEFLMVHMALILQHGLFGHLPNPLSRFLRRYPPAVILLSRIETGTDQPVEDIRNQVPVLQHHIHPHALLFPHQRLGLESHAFRGQSKAHEMHAQLVFRIVIQQFIRHGRLYGRAAAGLCVQIQQMPVRYDRGQMHLFHIGLRPPGRLEPGKQPRLGNDIKVDIVLPDELVHLRLIVAPPFLQLLLSPPLPQIRPGERNRRPQGFRPYPESQVLQILTLRKGYAPFHISGEPERNQGLPGSVMNPHALQYGLCLIPVIQGLEFEQERVLPFPVHNPVHRQALRQFLQALHIFLRHIQHGLLQEFLHGLQLVLPGMGVLSEKIIVFFHHADAVLQRKIPVLHLPQHRLPAGQAADGIYQF